MKMRSGKWISGALSVLVALILLFGPLANRSEAGEPEQDIDVALVSVQQADFGFDGGGIRPGSNDLARSYRDQWATETLGLEDAQEFATGARVTVAVLDTGLDVNHPVLRSHVSPIRRNFVPGADPADVADVGNGLDDDGNGKIDEAVGHGTFIAGLIQLVAPNAMIMPLKVLNSDGHGRSLRVADAIRFAVDNGASVINLSFGTTKQVPAAIDAMHQAVKYAHEKRVVVVAPTGNVDNTGSGAQEVLYPARYEEVLAVLATNREDEIAAFSRIGRETDLGAPGVQLISLYPGGRYARASGTSMAAGIASGSAAVVQSERANWTSGQIMSRLESTAESYEDLRPSLRGLVGKGVIDLKAAVRQSSGRESSR